MHVPGLHSKNTHIRHAVGSLFILIGALGIILPVAPGVIFVVLGLEALGLRAVLLARFEERIPKRLRYHMHRHDHAQKSTDGPGGSRRSDLPAS